MKKTFIIFLIIITFITISCKKENVTGTDSKSQIDYIINKYHKEGNFYGDILVYKNNKLLYKGDFNKENEKYPIYSVSKQFTSMLILQLVEENKLRLDDKVIDIIPEVLPNEFKNKGKDITIYNLLTQTSGLSPISRKLNFESKVYSKKEIINSFITEDLLFKPGTSFKYVNSNYYLLGIIIEKVTNKTYSECLKVRICKPLGLENTGYYTSIENSSKEFEKNTLNLMINYYSAGGIYSTVEDLYIWEQSLYTNKLLSKEYRDILFKPFLRFYGCGWYIHKNFEDKKIIWHGGSKTSNISNSYIARIPSENTTVILLTNELGIPKKLLKQIGHVIGIYK
ncbi:MAG: beta-lactamase family protein [Firmicutes bacterium]|nr:beta-lactamase family protein [Bacillota bacterium]